MGCHALSHVGGILFVGYSLRAVASGSPTGLTNKSSVLSKKKETENKSGSEHTEKISFHNGRRKLTKPERIASYFTIPFPIVGFFVAAEITNIGLAIFMLCVNAFLIFYFERDKFWHERILFTVLLLFNFLPTGIYFTWRNKNWAKTVGFFLVYFIVHSMFSTSFSTINHDPTLYTETQQSDTLITSDIKSSDQPDISVGMSQALADFNINMFVSRNGGSYNCASFPDEPSYQICIYQGKRNFEFHMENGFVEKVF